MAAGRTDIRVRAGREDSHGLAVGARVERAVDAAQSLSDLLWEELRRSPASSRSAELAEHIADLAATVALLARAGEDTTAWEPTTRAAPAPAAPTRERSRAVLVDERDEDASERWWRSSGPRGWDERLEENGRPRQPAWLEQLASALAEFERARVPFAVLLVEVLDGGTPDQIEATLARALDAIAPASIAAEDPRRYWVLVPRADAIGALEVADRLAHELAPADGNAHRADAADRYFAALSALGSRHNGQAVAPLRIVAGTAACPESGLDVSSLVARAHIELAHARSASVSSGAVSEAM